jgi:hypothetical protein
MTEATPPTPGTEPSPSASPVPKWRDPATIAAVATITQVVLAAAAG